MKWFSGGCLVVVFLLVGSMVACLSIDLRAFSDDIGALVQNGGEDGDGSGTCDNSGAPPPLGNPFFGVPVQFVISGDEDISAIYCDPAYFIDFGTIHYGVDFRYPLGTAVVATTKHDDGVRGQIERVEYDHPMRGNNIKLCENSFCAVYMHLHEIYVVEGQFVDHGEVIGSINSTGNSTGNHLHYELIDPIGNYFDPVGTW